MKTNSTLRIGVGKTDITPEMGIQIAGDIGRLRPVKEIHHPLHAKAMIMEQDNQRFCLIYADVTGVMRSVSDKVRAMVAEKVSCPVENIIVFGTQSHSSPMVGNHMMSDDFELVPDDLPWLRGGDDRYIPTYLKGVEQAVDIALSSMTEATMKFVRGVDGRVAFNRRFILRDGTVRTHPGMCQKDILYCEGPVDPEVSLVTFENSHGSVFAALLHHTCHPVHGYPMNYICPDWPGLWGASVERLFGGNCIALTLNGACGNIHHTNHLDPNHKRDVNAFTKCLTETVERIIPDLTEYSSATAKMVSKSLRIKRRKLTDEALAEARKIIADNPEPMWIDESKNNINWDWVYALATLNLEKDYQRQDTYDYEIQVLRLGDLAISAWPGEPFVEAQLELKLNSSAPINFVVHFANDSAGYLPTQKAFQNGGYETRTANWSKLDESALDMVSAETIKIHKKLFAEA